MLSVRPFPLFKSRKTKTTESNVRYWRDYGSGRVDHWWHLSCEFYICKYSYRAINWPPAVDKNIRHGGRKYLKRIPIFWKGQKIPPPPPHSFQTFFLFLAWLDEKPQCVKRRTFSFFFWNIEIYVWVRQ